MMWIVFGLIAMLVGMVVMVRGSMWGLVLLLGGVGLTFFHYVTMMLGRRQDPEQGTLSGLKGEGRQQSETVHVNLPEQGEQSSDIWEKLEK